MTNKILSLKYLLPLFILAASVAVSYAIIAQAQTDSTSSPQAAITFPVPELGNCGSKSECRDYCNQPANMEACIKFAQSKGLMDKEEANRGLKFQKRMLSGGGPGGCNSPESCKSFCGDAVNAEVCLKFAEEQGFKHEKAEEAKKFRVFKQLIEKKETPGDCKSKDECEKYCSSEANKEECIAFAKRMGILDEKRAESFRKEDRKGPGDCDSKESCRAYCNDPANQESCLKFAEEKGVIKEGEAEEAKENFMKLRQGLQGVSSTIAICLKSNLGTNIIEDIRAGKLTPGTEINDRVKNCFESRDEKREEVRPANFKELRKFIKEGTSTDEKVRPENFKERMMQDEDGKPGLNKETFEKFRQKEESRSEGFGASQKIREQLQQQFKERLQISTPTPEAVKPTQ